MPLREILKESDPVLNRRSRPVEKFDQRHHELLEDMVETMYEGDGVGLAAPQIGVLRRIFVMDVGEGPLAFINPEIMEEDGEQEGPEGCLSLPGLFGIVSRPQKVRVRAQDREGVFFEITAEDLAARCVCHENDHLDGILFRRHSQVPLCSFDELPGYEPEEEAEEGGDA